MKKAIMPVLYIIMCFALSVTASAKAVLPGTAQPYYDKASEATSVLTMNGTTATCTSTCMGYSDVVQIVAVQTLEKQGAWWSWSTYNNTTWTKTVYKSTLTMSNTKSGLESGTYRLKTVFTLTDKNGKSETITVYSD